jgi:hypothetical protein
MAAVYLCFLVMIPIILKTIRTNVHLDLTVGKFSARRFMLLTIFFVISCCIDTSDSSSVASHTGSNRINETDACFLQVWEI